MSQTRLPHLRQELQILKAPQSEAGAPQWFIFDPIKNAFHVIGEKGLKLLNKWQAGPIDDMVDHVSEDGLSDVDILAMSDFLYTQQLTIEPPGGTIEALANREAAKRRPFYETLVHRYLFFRIPLFAPDRFLRAVYPVIAPFFTKWSLVFSAVIGLIGLYFTLGQWDQFTRTFWHFFTLEGLAFYILALIAIKSLHELGHAFIAHHFGTRVPTLGVAFLVMFPVLFTDTTDAWRLLDHRKRVLIDGAGMIVELMIACLSIFLWAFLPDGPLRSLAFFAATTSWAFSLLVNLNPCMRFDGYYLISDTLRVPNLQKTGFELGRWKMREVLFQLGEPQPTPNDGLRYFGLLTYAYATWIYRFFLFIGIALLVHHIFPKAIGIILFSVEIIFFIIRPIVAELKNWWSLRMTILDRPLARKRTRLSLIVTGLFIFTLIWPWQRQINAPARLEPAQHTEIFPPTAATIAAIHVNNDARVKRGDKLFTLNSETLDFEIRQSESRLDLLKAQILRRASNLQERRIGTTLESEYRREHAAYDGLIERQTALIIKAPQDGIISEIGHNLHSGRIVTMQERLASLSEPGQIKLLALAPEQDAERIKVKAPLIFLADDPALPKLNAVITHQAPTARSVIKESELTSTYGGKIAVHPETENGLVPVNPVYEIQALIERESSIHDSYKGRTIRGLAKIKGPRENYVSRIGRQIWRVLIREGDF